MSLTSAMRIAVRGPAAASPAGSRTRLIRGGPMRGTDTPDADHAHRRHAGRDGDRAGQEQPAALRPSGRPRRSAWSRAAAGSGDVAARRGVRKRIRRRIRRRAGRPPAPTRAGCGAGAAARAVRRSTIRATRVGISSTTRITKQVEHHREPEVARPGQQPPASTWTAARPRRRTSPRPARHTDHQPRADPARPPGSGRGAHELAPQVVVDQARRPRTRPRETRSACST